MWVSYNICSLGKLLTHPRPLCYYFRIPLFIHKFLNLKFEYR